MSWEQPAPARKRSVGQIIALVVGLGFAAPCFCCAGLFLLVPEQEGGLVAPSPPQSSDDAVDLGTALFPIGHQNPVATPYDWRAAALNPGRYAVRYGLAAGLGEQLAQEFQAIGKKMRFRKVGKDRIAFDAVPQCQRDLRCIYADLAKRHRGIVAPLSLRFLDRAREARLNHQELAILIVTFVQHLRYDLPEQHPFGVLPPALVAYEGWGDCDSKALLAILLLQACGIEAAMLSSQQLAHAAVGVALPGSGTAFEARGRRYLYAEVTAEGWPIGRMPPKYDQPRLWEVVWVADPPRN